MDSVFAPVDQASSTGKALPWVNVASFIVVIAINGISSAGAISKYGIGEVSDLYRTALAPAGYAFSIWGLIYFAVAVFVIWQAIASVRDDYIVFNRIGWWFAVSCLFNCAWIMVFVQATLAAIWISTILLFVIFGSLLMLITRVNVWNRAFAVSSPSANNFTEFNENALTAAKQPSVLNTLVTYFAVDFAFSVYCAWTTVASILNVSLSLSGSGVQSNQTEWAIAILCVAASIFGLMVLLPSKANWAYGFVFTWAALAITSARKTSECADVIGFGDNETGCLRVQKASTALAAIVGVAAALRMIYFFFSLWQHRTNKAAATDLEARVNQQSSNQSPTA